MGFPSHENTSSKVNRFLIKIKLISLFLRHADTTTDVIRITVTFDDGFDESGDYDVVNFVTSRQASSEWKVVDKYGYVKGVGKVPHSRVVKKDDLREGMRGYARYDAHEKSIP